MERSSIQADDEVVDIPGGSAGFGGLPGRFLGRLPPISDILECAYRLDSRRRHRLDYVVGPHISTVAFDWAIAGVLLR